MNFLEPAVSAEKEDDDDGDGGDDGHDDPECCGAGLEGKSHVHTVERGSDGGDVEDDGESGEEFDGAVDIVGEDDLVRVS